jgi:Domain of unknown function (DUF397)
VSPYDWQTSSYSQDGVNCVNVAAAPDGTIRLRESDDPDVVVTSTPAALAALIARIKADLPR